MHNVALRERIAQALDTRDKRFMFLRLTFPESVNNIDLEGSPSYVAFEILKHFEYQGYLKELEEVFDKHFPNT